MIIEVNFPIKELERSRRKNQCFNGIRTRDLCEYQCDLQPQFPYEQYFNYKAAVYVSISIYMKTTLQIIKQNLAPAVSSIQRKRGKNSSGRMAIVSILFSRLLYLQFKRFYNHGPKSCGKIYIFGAFSNTPNKQSRANSSTLDHPLPPAPHLQC